VGIPRALTRLALLIAVVLLAAACQGDDDSATSTTTTVVRTTTTSGASDSGSSSFDLIPTLVDQVQPSVVSVATNTGQGSGVVYDSDGFVITNHHVIDGAQTIAIVLANGDRLRAKLRASTDRYDIAVLEVDRDGLPAATFAKQLPQIGELALAMGNPIGFENSVTQGIVSGVHRAIPAGGSTPSLVDLIQTDAAISPGNSGGALVDDAAQVIGINVAYLPPQQGAVSLGFAIPAPVATEVAQQLIDTGKVDFAYVGIEPTQVTPELTEAFDLGTETGVLVGAVPEGGPADEAGIQEGDVIVKLDDREIEAVEDLFAELREHKPGETVTVTVMRGGEEKDVDVTLGQAGAS
jgi:serine protease DegQ